MSYAQPNNMNYNNFCLIIISGGDSPYAQPDDMNYNNFCLNLTAFLAAGDSLKSCAMG